MTAPSRASRCLVCGRRIYPWQRMGWYVGQTFTFRWHGRCAR